MTSVAGFVWPAVAAARSCTLRRWSLEAREAASSLQWGRPLQRGPAWTGWCRASRNRFAPLAQCGPSCPIACAASRRHSHHLPRRSAGMDWTVQSLREETTQWQEAKPEVRTSSFSSSRTTATTGVVAQSTQVATWLSTSSYSLSRSSPTSWTWPMEGTMYSGKTPLNSMMTWAVEAGVEAVMTSTNQRRHRRPPTFSSPARCQRPAQCPSTPWRRTPALHTVCCVAPLYGSWSSLYCSRNAWAAASDVRSWSYTSSSTWRLHCLPAASAWVEIRNKEEKRALYNSSAKWLSCAELSCLWCSVVETSSGLLLSLVCQVWSILLWCSVCTSRAWPWKLQRTVRRTFWLWHDPGVKFRCGHLSKAWSRLARWWDWRVSKLVLCDCALLLLFFDVSFGRGHTS